MKKISILGVCLMACFSAIAQTNLVKDVERQLKDANPDYAAALKAIQPTFTNPETSGTMMPWYLAGKAGFGLYDQLFIQEQMGQPLSPEQKKQAGHAIIDGYNYYFKALHLDSIPDAKGKIKPKKSKEILKLLGGNYAQLRNAGIFLFDSKDYNGAYDAWELYATLPSNPLLGDKAPVADPDTIVGQIKFYQAIAMLTADDNKRALEKIQQVIPTGYTTIDVYRYGVEAARRLDDSVAMLDLAQKGYELYGTDDISFIGQLINEKLGRSDYQSCFTLVNEAIGATSEANSDMLSQLYDIRGYINEQDGKNEQSMADFQKAIDLNPKYAKAYFDLGRMYNNMALKKAEEIGGDVLSEELKTEFLKAAELFEKAYDLDSNMTQIPGALYRLYYKLGAGYEMQTNDWKAISGS